MGRRLTVVLIVSILLVSLTSSVSSLFEKKTINQEEIIVTLKSNEYTIQQLENGCCKIRMDEFGYDAIPDKPWLPAKTFNVGIPPNAAVSSISVIRDNQIQLAEAYKLAQTPSLLPLKKEQFANKKTFISTHTQKTTEEDKQNSYRYLGKRTLEGYTVAQIRFYPFTYENNQLTLHKEMRLSIKCRSNNKTLRNSYALSDDDLSEKICNYDSIQQYYQSVPVATTLSEHFEYVIITSEKLKGAVEEFKNHKENRGYSVKIVTTSWIYDEYKNSGEDKAKAIRDFLKDKYRFNDGWDIQYVLLVGSPSTIPMRYACPMYNDSSHLVPTDHYYADLTGGWDCDGDGLYGECYEDEPHFTAEVYVGRIPFDNPSTVKSICRKIKRFENDEGNWKKNSLLLGPILYYNQENHESGVKRIDGATLLQQMKKRLFKPANYEITTMYEKEGVKPSQYSCSKALSKSNVINEWKKGYGIVNWHAHGDTTSVQRNVWVNDSDADGIPDYDELQYRPFFSKENTGSLDNSRPSIVFSCSCYTADPDSSNLGFSLLKKGAVTFIGATREVYGKYGWDGPEDGGVATFNYYFLSRFLDKFPLTGKAFYEAKSEYDWKFSPPFGGPVHYQNLYSFCIYGDPSLTRLTTDPPQVEIIKPGNYLYIGDGKIIPTLRRPIVIGRRITAQATITSQEAETHIENVEFYLDNELIGGQCGDREVYEYTFWGRMQGSHVIKVVAHDNMGGRGTTEKEMLAFIP